MLCNMNERGEMGLKIRISLFTVHGLSLRRMGRTPFPPKIGWNYRTEHGLWHAQSKQPNDRCGDE